MLALVAEQLAHAAAPQHRLRDQRRLRAVVAGLDEALESLRLHGISIDRGTTIMSSW
jgi:hypothetical protein